MRALRLLVVMVTASCSSLPAGAVFRCEATAPRCPSGLECRRVADGEYCVVPEGAAGGSAGGVAGGSAGGVAGGSAGGVAGGSAGGVAGGSAGGSAGGGSAGGCSSQPINPGLAVFVSASSGTDTNDGFTPNMPVRTVARGLAQLIATGRQELAIVSGQYTDSLRFMTGTTRLVGVAADGSRLCAPSVFPRITSTTPIGLEVTSGNVTVEQLHLVGIQGTSLQPSSYGAFISGGVVTLTDVTLESSEAAPGVSPPMAQTPGPSTCNGLNNCSDGRAGFNGAPGAPSDGGAFGAAGFIPGAGARGVAGGHGFNGTASVAQSYTNCISSCTGATPCTNSSLFCGAIGSGQVMATRGHCGCGGTGASPGEPGGGGGASIALLVTGSGSVTMTRGRLQTGRGGNGGAGGLPSMPLAGTAGTAGSSASCFNFIGGSCGRSQCNAPCEQTGPTVSVTATTGGQGGTGGLGGLGGGGAGGPSLGWVRVGSTAVVTVSLQTMFLFGPGGNGSGGARDGLSAVNLVWP